jgi:hypothetical protein
VTALVEIQGRLAGIATNLEWHREQLVHAEANEYPWLKDHVNSIARLQLLQTEYTGIIERLEAP